MQVSRPEAAKEVLVSVVFCSSATVSQFKDVTKTKVTASYVLLCLANNPKTLDLLWFSVFALSADGLHKVSVSLACQSVKYSFKLHLLYLFLCPPDNIISPERCYPVGYHTHGGQLKPET